MRKKKTNSRVTEHLMVLFEKEGGTARRVRAADRPRDQPTPVRPPRGKAPRVASRPGRGAVSGQVAGQVAGLAASAPEQLLEKLGIKEIVGENDLEKIQSVLSKAVENETMRKAFGAPVTDEGTQIIQIPIESKEINARDGSMYIRYTLKAASGIMSLSGDVIIRPGDRVVEVQSKSIA